LPQCWQQAASLQAKASDLAASVRAAPGRHTGCVFVALRDALSFQGFRLVVLGVGTPASGRLFCSRLTPALPEASMFVDPQRRVYAALGLYSGFGRTFLQPETGRAVTAPGFGDALRAATKNYTMVAPPKPDDALQQGGLLVLDGEKVLYAWRDAGTADHAPLGDVLAAVAAAGAAA